MKILFVIPDLSVGGTNSSLENLLESVESIIPNAEISVFPITSCGELQDKFKKYRTIQNNHILNYWFGQPKFFKGSKKIIKLLFRVLKKADNILGLNIEDRILKFIASKEIFKDYDIVVGYQEGLATTFASVIEAKKHYLWIHCNLKYSNYKFEKFKKDYNQADKVICVSKSAQNTFDQIYPSEKSKSSVIYNKIDVKKIRTISSQTDNIPLKITDANTYILVSVGRLTPVKQFHKIPEIASFLKKQSIPFKWIVVGSGSQEYSNRIQQEINKYNLSDEIIMTGYSSNPYYYISKADLYVCTSESEACPMVFLEANALGKYVISNEFPSAHELLTPSTGTICNINNIGLQISERLDKTKNLTVPINSDFYNNFDKQIDELFSID